MYLVKKNKQMNARIVRQFSLHQAMAESLVVILLLGFVSHEGYWSGRWCVCLNTQSCKADPISLTVCLLSVCLYALSFIPHTSEMMGKITEDGAEARLQTGSKHVGEQAILSSRINLYFTESLADICLEMRLNSGRRIKKLPLMVKHP